MLPETSVGQILLKFRPNRTQANVQTQAIAQGVAMSANALLRDVWRSCGTLRRNDIGDLVRMLELHILQAASATNEVQHVNPLECLGKKEEAQVVADPGHLARPIAKSGTEGPD